MKPPKCIAGRVGRRKCRCLACATAVVGESGREAARYAAMRKRFKPLPMPGDPGKPTRYVPEIDEDAPIRRR